jgi:hypothetical protein
MKIRDRRKETDCFKMGIPIWLVQRHLLLGVFATK